MPITIKYTLDESDTKYFRNLYRTAKKNAKNHDPDTILQEVKELIDRVRSAKKQPSIVEEAITTLEDQMQMLEDEDYALPKSVANQALTALAYFAKAEDVIPDHIPALGFLDDAIMIKLVEEEFRHELWGYRRFRSFRGGAEQRPWTKVARERLPKRLLDKRKQIRAQVEEKKKKDEAKKLKTGGGFSW